MESNVLADGLTNYASEYLIIDHHELQTEKKRNANEKMFCKSEYSSTGELIYDFFSHIESERNSKSICLLQESIRVEK